MKDMLPITTVGNLKHQILNDFFTYFRKNPSEFCCIFRKKSKRAMQNAMFPPTNVIKRYVFNDNGIKKRYVSYYNPIEKLSLFLR